LEHGVGESCRALGAFLHPAHFGEGHERYSSQVRRAKHFGRYGHVRGGPARLDDADTVPIDREDIATLVPRAKLVLHLDDELTLLEIAAERESLRYFDKAYPATVCPPGDPKPPLVLQQKADGLVHRPARRAELFCQVYTEQESPQRDVGIV